MEMTPREKHLARCAERNERDRVRAEDVADAREAVIQTAEALVPWLSDVLGFAVMQQDRPRKFVAAVKSLQAAKEE